MFWISRPDKNQGGVYDIVEESLDYNTMICLTTATSPDMLWLKGTKTISISNTGGETPIKNSYIDLTNEYPDLTALKKTNTDAIDDANSRIAFVFEEAKEPLEAGGNTTESTNDAGGASGQQPKDAGVKGSSNDNISRAPFDTGAVKTPNAPSLVDDISTPIYNEGSSDGIIIAADEDLVSTTLPEKVLKSEKRLVNALSDLNDLRKKVYELEIQVGGHRIKLQTFHYPEINLETPINKLRRTYIDKDDLPNLFSYEFKSALTSQVKVLKYMEMLAADAVANSNY